MGCLKKIIIKIFVIAGLVAFFFFGGADLIGIKYYEYTNPPREELIAQSADFGDFSGVSSDYYLSRSLNFMGYRKFNVTYLPTRQKITILDLKDKNIIKPQDFQTKEVDKKIDDILKNFKDSVVTLENLEITNRGVIYAKNKAIPYVNFKSSVKNIPFRTVEGMIAAYDSKNTSTKFCLNWFKDKKQCPTQSKNTTKIIVSMRNANRYNQQISTDFIKSIKF